MGAAFKIIGEVDLKDKSGAKLRAVTGNMETNLKSFRSRANAVASKAFDFGKAAGAVGLGLGATLVAPIKAAADMQKMNIALRSSFQGNKAQADEAFKTITDFAAKTPYAMEEALGGFLKLKNLGMDPSMKAMESYGNTASAMGKSLDQMVEAVADASMGEFERLKEFGIKASTHGNKVEFTFGKTKTVVGKNAKEIQAYIKSIGDKNFAGAMEEQSKSIYGQWSTLTDNMKMSMAKVGEKLIPILNDLFDKVGPIIDKVAKWIEKNPELTGTIVKVVAGAAVLSLGISALSFTFGGLVKGLVAVHSGCGRLAEAYNKLTGKKKGLRIVTDENTSRMSRFSKFMSEKAGPAIKKFGVAVKDYGGKALTAIGTATRKSLTWVGSSVGSMFSKLGAATTALGSKLSFMGRAVSGAFKMVGGAFSAVGRMMAANPILAAVLIIAAVAFLLIKNWDTVKKWFSDFGKWFKNNWDIVLSIFMPFIGIPAMIIKRWGTIKKFFTDLINYFKGTFIGKMIMKMVGGGIEEKKQEPVKKIAAVTKDMRDHLPSSPAKKGAFKDLHKVKIVETLAKTIKLGPLGIMAKIARGAVDLFTKGLKQPGSIQLGGVVASGSAITANFTINLNGSATKQDGDMLKRKIKECLDDMQKKQTRLSLA